MGKAADSVDPVLEGECQRLRERCRAIQLKWKALREGDAASSPAERAPGLLKRELYRLGWELHEKAWRSDAKELVRSATASARIDWNSPKAIWIALLTLIDVGEKLPRPERHRYAAELQYARRHRIPVELVNGFIWQVGGAKRIAQFDDEHLESWFDPELHTPERLTR